MKNLFNYLLPALLLFISRQSSAQTALITVDLSTGISNSLNTQLPINSAPWPYNSADDTWSVHTPTDAPNVYQPAGIGSGIIEYLGYTYPGKSSNVRWISPYVNTMGEHRQVVPAGTYQYKMTFNISSCAIQSATFAFAHWLVDDVFDRILLNGVNLIGNITPLPSTSGNYNYIITGAGFNQGLNTLIVEVTNSPVGWTGMEMDAKLYLKTCAYVDMNVKDKFGTVKEDFCIDEDVFLNTTGATPNSYNVTLQQLNGSSYSTIVTTSDIGGSPTELNVTDLLANQYSVTFAPYYMYKVILTMNSFCGSYQIEKTFKFSCCGSPDASFSLFSTPEGISGKNTTGGAHSWVVYNSTSPSPLNTFETPSFSYSGSGPCYFIKHTVSNICGTSCITKSFCKTSCELQPCVLTAPTGLTINTRGNTVSWNPVSGAVSYIIEVLMNDPECCGGTVWISVPPIYISTTSTTYTLTNGELGVLSSTLGVCFSWKVYAVCADGSRSEAAKKCSSGL